MIAIYIILFNNNFIKVKFKIILQVIDYINKIILSKEAKY